MSRGIRRYSESGIYHIVFRGVNKQNIFLDDFDYSVMLGYIKEVKNNFPFEVYAFCMMSNHVHLLIKENETGDISQIMKKILVKYALYFNNKYCRSGHLFESRYKSKPIDSDDYLFASLRYIHQNPVKASITERLEDYSWSSYSEYVKNTEVLTDKKFILSLISLKQFERMHREGEEELDPFDEKLGRRKELAKHILIKYNVEPNNLANLPRREKRVILEDVLQRYSCADISYVTGINKNTLLQYKN